MSNSYWGKEKAFCSQFLSHSLSRFLALGPACSRPVSFSVQPLMKTAIVLLSLRPCTHFFQQRRLEHTESHCLPHATLGLVWCITALYYYQSSPRPVLLYNLLTFFPQSEHGHHTPKINSERVYKPPPLTSVHCSMNAWLIVVQHSQKGAKCVVRAMPQKSNLSTDGLELKSFETCVAVLICHIRSIQFLTTEKCFSLCVKKRLKCLESVLC